MEQGEVTASGTILRRVPPKPNHTFPIPGGLRASSIALRGERGKQPSYTRSSITSPKQLLDKLEQQGKPSEGWMVARLKVADVLAMKWVVVACAEPGDEGHCVIKPGAEPFSDTKWSRLAKKSRILDPSEVEALKLGDPIA